MTENEQGKAVVELSAVEQSRLQQVSSAAPPYGQRAQALLALAEGADPAAAGITAGLTANQVRYWLGRFRTRRLSIFPEELLAGAPAQTEAQKRPPLLAPTEEAPMLAELPKAPALAGPKVAGELAEGAAAETATAAAVTAASSAEPKKKKKKKKAKEKTKKSAKSEKGKGKGKKKSKKGKDDKKGKQEKSKKLKKGKKQKKSKK